MKYAYIVNHIQLSVRGSRNNLTSYRIANNAKLDIVGLIKYAYNGVENIDFYNNSEMVVNIITDKGMHSKVISGKKLKSIFNRIVKHKCKAVK